MVVARSNATMGLFAFANAIEIFIVEECASSARIVVIIHICYNTAAILVRINPLSMLLSERIWM